MVNQEKDEKGRRVAAPLLIGGLFAAILYFGLPNYRYFVDGLMSAINMSEAQGLIVHPHHPLHPLLPQIVYLSTSGGTGWNELELLNVWSISIGVLGCWALIMVFRRGGMAIDTVLIGLGFFVFSRAIWYFCVTPNQNSTALTFHIFTLLAITAYANRLPGTLNWRNITVIGVLTGLSILTSQINTVLILPSIYLLLQGDVPLRSKFRKIAGYLLSVLLIAGGLFIIIGVVLAGFRTPTDFFHQQHSYVLESRWWAVDFFDAVRRTWYGMINVHVASVFRSDGLFGNWLTGFGTLSWFLSLTLRLGQAAVLIFLGVETIRAFVEWIRSHERSHFQTIGLAVALPIMLFSCVWAPESSNYRILYIPGLLLFLMPAIEKRFSLDKFNFRRAWLVLFVLACLFTVNFNAQFGPESDPLNNPYIYETFRLRESVKPGDLIIYSGTDEGRMRGLYVRYFLECDIAMIQELMPRIRGHPAEFAVELIERHNSGGLLLIHQDALSSIEDIEWMNKQYGVGIQPEEVVNYFKSWAEPVSACTINEKHYFQFMPREEE